MQQGVSRRELARLLGASLQSIARWETNRTVPALRWLPAIVTFLGYVPYDPTAPLRQRHRRQREAQGLTMRQFAATRGVVPSTVWRWERGGTRPRFSRHDA
jgi:transcriptional regulator with XRE-family HTH domain